MLRATCPASGSIEMQARVEIWPGGLAATRAEADTARCMRLLSCCLVAGAIAAGCGGSSASEAATHLPPCVSRGVALSLGPRVSPMTGEHAVLYELMNVSPRACVLDGYPRVTASHLGKRLPFVYRDGGGQYVTTRAPRRVTLRPGRHAYFLVARYRCDVGILSTATSVRVLLPATTRGAMTLPGRDASEFDYCRRSPDDRAIDPGIALLCRRSPRRGRRR